MIIVYIWYVYSPQKRKANKDSYVVEGGGVNGDIFLTIRIKMYCSTLIAFCTSNELAPPQPLFSVRYSDRGFN